MARRYLFSIGADDQQGQALAATSPNNFWNAPANSNAAELISFAPNVILAAGGSCPLPALKVSPLLAASALLPLWRTVVFAALVLLLRYVPGLLPRDTRAWRPAHPAGHLFRSRT